MKALRAHSSWSTASKAFVRFACASAIVSCSPAKEARISTTTIQVGSKLRVVSDVQAPVFVTGTILEADGRACPWALFYGLLNGGSDVVVKSDPIAAATTASSSTPNRRVRVRFATRGPQFDFYATKLSKEVAAAHDAQSRVRVVQRGDEGFVETRSGRDQKFAEWSSGLEFGAGSSFLAQFDELSMRPSDQPEIEPYIGVLEYVFDPAAYEHIEIHLTGSLSSFAATALTETVR